MFEVDNIKSDNNVSGLSMCERFDKINSKKVDTKVLEYLKEKFQNLRIEVCGDYEGTLIELMKDNLLEQWCWQTTESSIIFLNDDDYIERGILKFTEDEEEYHSWICFRYEDREYTLDSCLNLLCEKDLYHKIFEVRVKGKSTAKQVRDSLIDSINTPKKDEDNYYSEDAKKIAQQCMMLIFGKDYKRDEEVLIIGNDDINSPMYRNETGYKAEIENGKVKKLIAHYYKNL